MERPSEASQSRGSTWKGLLIITASILSCWIQPTSAQDITVVPQPTYVQESDNVILNIQGYTGSPREYVWYRKKSAQDPGRVKIVTYNPATKYLSPSNSRQRVFANGSLIIPNLVGIDDAYYEVQINDSSSQILTGGALVTVYDKYMRKPTVTIQSAGHIVQNDSAVMKCNSRHNDLSQIRWYFQNKKLILNDRRTLPSNNKTLMITPVKREDNGAYQCEVWNPLNARKSDPFNLSIIYGPEEIKILPKHVHGQIEVLLNKKLTLECQASSEPPAQYTWQVNGSSRAGNSGNIYAISKLSWGHSGTYTCMAMNSITNTAISKNIIVRVYEPSGGSIRAGQIVAGIVIGVLAGVALMVALIYYMVIGESSG